MNARTCCLPLLVVAGIFLSANPAGALGFQLGETKEQLKLKYDVSVTDHGNGRVSITLTIADEGRLTPLNSVDLHIPSQDETGYADLSLSMAAKKVDGKLVASVHLKKELAERAQIQLRTSSLDGKRLGLTWYYLSIPLAEHLKKAAPKKD
ncbi:hypothetical protein [Zavarzinella formosa]|uniref:hypothetical protein n=1 Tax=Zavarzinella formosa TaxID=360055 RepID=UPI0003162282|nr:hypothetical protein [Zavarzinella formosa]